MNGGRARGALAQPQPSCGGGHGGLYRGNLAESALVLASWKGRRSWQGAGLVASLGKRCFSSHALLGADRLPGDKEHQSCGRRAGALPRQLEGAQAIGAPQQDQSFRDAPYLDHSYLFQ